VVVDQAPVTSGEAAERTFREQGPKLWRSLLAFTGDPDLASDAMAEAYAQLLGRGEAVGAHDRWVWRAAFRIAAGELKDRRRRVSRLQPAKSYEMPEPALDLIRALDRLSPNQRAVAVWVHGNREDSTDAVRPDVLFQIDPATNRYVGSMELPSQEFTLAVDGGSLWQRTPSGVVLIDPDGPLVWVQLEGMEEHCCSHIASDGRGGVWAVASGGPGRMQVVHVTPDGQVDGRAEVVVPVPVLDSVAVALDPERQTLWLAQYEDTVTPLRLART
jgi:hypothetical protein